MFSQVPCFLGQWSRPHSQGNSPLVYLPWTWDPLTRQEGYKICRAVWGLPVFGFFICSPSPWSAVMRRTAAVFVSSSADSVHRLVGSGQCTDCCFINTSVTDLEVKTIQKMVTEIISYSVEQNCTSHNFVLLSREPSCTFIAGWLSYVAT